MQVAAHYIRKLSVADKTEVTEEFLSKYPGAAFIHPIFVFLVMKVMAIPKVCCFVGDKIKESRLSFLRKICPIIAFGTKTDLVGEGITGKEKIRGISGLKKEENGWFDVKRNIVLGSAYQLRVWSARQRQIYPCQIELC